MDHGNFGRRSIPPSPHFNVGLYFEVVAAFWQRWEFLFLPHNTPRIVFNIEVGVRGGFDRSDRAEHWGLEAALV